MQECSQCRETLPFSEFYAKKGGKYGIHSECILCCRERSRRSLASRKRRGEPIRRSKTKYAGHWKALQRGYAPCDLSLEERASIKKAHSGICEIDACLQLAVVIDHDHDTGKYRGMLCRNCNSGLGMFRDTPAVMRGAATYMERFTIA